LLKQLRRKIELKLLLTWQNKNGLAKVLRPLSWLFCFIVYCRKLAYRLKLKHTEKLAVPVIVVGNLTVGGTGKTPLVIWLADFLKKNGYKPGILCRGYGGKARHWPQQVRPDSDPVAAGDEPVLISKRTGCPMAAGPDRITAGKALLHYHPQVNVIISDDGLQHYALDRDIEIAVIDGARRFGNEYCLPAGPLREPVKRLEKVDLVVTNGVAAKDEYAMRYQAVHFCQLLNESQTRPLQELKGLDIHAVAGIGNPERFFAQLEEYGAIVTPHAYSDHHAYQPDDIEFGDNKNIVMTEKDAVKCRRYANERHWYIPVTAELEAKFGTELLKLLRETGSNG